VLLNLAGHGAPVLAALFAVPVLLRSLGTDRFGVLALAWVVVAFAGVLDLGIGRAVTQMISASTAHGEHQRIGRLLGTAIVAAAAIGLALGMILALISSELFRHLVKLPMPLTEEAVRATRVLAIAVPAVLLGNVLRGVLEAHQRFLELALVRGALGTLLLVAPLIALRAAPTLVAVMWSLVITRWLAIAVLLVLARRTHRATWRPDLRELAALARMGSWMTVSTLVASLMLYADRFVIGGLLSASEVAYYAAPFEVIQRFALVPAAVMGVFFPVFSHRAASESADLAGAYRSSRIAVFALMAPVAIATAVFSKPLLTTWLGADFAEKSAVVASVLAIGVLIHGLVQPPFNLLQAAGRPDIPARFQMIEAPCYAVYLVALTALFGIVGTAVAWLSRVLISLVVQSWLARRYVVSRVNHRASTP
jgi:O-antigen/teichoic acid export membrane protein